MTLHKDTMPYFDKDKHVYSWNLSILLSPLKNLDTQTFYNGKFQAPSFQFLAKTLASVLGICP